MLNFVLLMLVIVVSLAVGVIWNPIGLMVPLVLWTIIMALAEAERSRDSRADKWIFGEEAQEQKQDSGQGRSDGPGSRGSQSPPGTA
jgi:hypothetical protein